MQLKQKLKQIVSQTYNKMAQTQKNHNRNYLVDLITIITK